MATKGKRQPSQGKLAPEKERASQIDALIHTLAERGITRAKIGGFDVDGVLRGKYVSLKKFESALRSGFGFCDVIFGWDVADALYDNSRVTGWHTGYPDAHAVLDPKTLRDIPWEPGVTSMLCDFRDGDGNDHPACPRSVLRRVIAYAEKLGFEPLVGVEFEFFLFRETPESAYEKGFADLTPVDRGMFGYSWIRTAQGSELMRDILDSMDAFGIPLEGLHTETGPGVYEAAITYSSALRAADNAALFKTVLKEIATRHGLVATFMAKCDAKLPGASGHLHQSLMRGGKNAFASARKPSKTLGHYIAGQLALMPELTAMYSPTINSYKRYVPGLWAPLTASWGYDNRTCAIRVLSPADPKAARVEYRQTAADINPYLAIAASLGAGLYGIEKQLACPPASTGEATDGAPLPTDLGAAAALFGRSRAAKKLFGAEFVDHFSRTRDFEWREYQRAVTNWELKRYFEII